MHKLTEKLWPKGGQFTAMGKDHADKIITDWLEEREEEIRKSYGVMPGSQLAGTRCLGDILGLTEPDHPDWCNVPGNHAHAKEPIVEKKQWSCEHIQVDLRGRFSVKGCESDDLAVFPLLQDWKFCPICGKSRPKKTTLEKKLSEELSENYFSHKGDVTSIKTWEMLAEVAIVFLKQRGVSK